MAEKKRFLDVWLVDSNTVYREVPFTVVIDWVQQGRLVETDQLRWSGQKDWFKLGGTPAFAAYIPRIETDRVEDQAEALERVEVDFAWQPRPPDDDDDVDMIPLIDVSLVLLIFFMMNAAVATAASLLNPAAATTPFSGDPGFWIGLKTTPEGQLKSFIFGQEQTAEAEITDRAEFLRQLKEKLGDKRGQIVTVIPDKELNFDAVEDVIVELQNLPNGVIVQKRIGVVEKR